MRQWQKLGEIFVEQGILTPQTVDRMLFVSLQRKKRFGLVLEEMGLVTADELVEALCRQFGLTAVTDFSKKAYPAELLELIDLELAIHHLVFPLRVHGASLDLAMVDPSDLKAIKSLEESSSLTVTPFISSKDDIHAAICRHYLGIEPTEPISQTILLVIDDPVTQQSIRSIMERYGYTILTATNGVQALKEITAGNPRMIMVNKVLPGADGLNFIKYIRSMSDTRKIPIILIYGTMTLEEEEEAFELGFFDYIRQPLSESSLVSSAKRAFWNIKRMSRAF